MNLQVVIASTDRTSLIKWTSVGKADHETNRVDTFRFSYIKFGSRTWVPAKEDEIVVTDTDTGDKVFGGRIVKVRPHLLANGSVNYDVDSKDYTVDLDDELVVQTFEAKTVKQIIDTIKPAGFTSTNVSSTATIDKIQFNYQKKSDCIRDLAELLNYHWWIDYDKDIHFVPKSGSTAPFNITDTSSNLIAGSLKMDDDSSQLRNRIYVLGGEEVGGSRTESYDADGDQDTFPLGNKFSSKPSVDLNSVAQTVGTAPLEDFADGPYQVLWNYNEKYIQFDTKPTAGQTVDITGTPLAQIAILQEDSASIAQYGIREFKIDDINIPDSDTARQRAAAELESYKDGITSGQFQTYTDGLRSGMTITVNSTALGINEAFIIKSVTMKMETRTKAIYTVKLVSHKIVDVITFLQDLLRSKDKVQNRAQNAVLTIVKSFSATINVAEVIGLDVEKTDHQTVDAAEQIRKDPWGAGVVTPVFHPYFPANDADPKRPARFDRNARFQ